MTDWQMRRIESPTENPCCALVREVGPYKATIWYVLEAQAWSADVMRGERLLVRWGCLPFADAVTFASETLDTLTQPLYDEPRRRVTDSSEQSELSG